MKIVEAKAELWRQKDDYSHIAKCARVCYASIPKIVGSDKNFCKKLWNNKHRSMFRHAGVYYIIPESLNLNWKCYSYCAIKIVNGMKYITTNKQCAKEYFSKYDRFKITKEEAFSNPVFVENKMLMFTFCIETGIDITRELNRKSPNNIAEQSTRYVDFNKRVGIRFKKCHWMFNLNFYKKCLVYIMCKLDEWFYKISRSKYGLNLPPEDARWCLFLDVMSKAIYTYTVKEWEYIINMRLFDWTGVAHKDAKIIAAQIANDFESLNYKLDNYKQNELNNAEHMVSLI